MINCENSRIKLIPIASGKGGVGKSLIAANLAALLAINNKRTIAVDMDLGGSNLHTYLGIKNKNPGIGNFLSGKEYTFDKLRMNTELDFLEFIPGDVAVSGVADVNSKRRYTVLKKLSSLDADYIIIDLSSGSAVNILDFFLISNAGIIVTTPRTPDIVNAFNFIKNLIFRFLELNFKKDKSITSYLSSIKKEVKPNSGLAISRIINGIKKISSDSGTETKNLIKTLKPKLIINMAISPDDLDIIKSLNSLLKKMTGIHLQVLGVVFYDDSVNMAVRDLTPLYTLGSSSIALRQINRIAHKIVQSKNYPDLPLDFSYYRDSFELARIEAQNDFDELEEDHNPQQGEDIKKEDLLRLVDAQQQKIEELQRTIGMLTLKKSWENEES